MNTKPTVIEGWISENVIDSKIAIAFKPGEKYFTADVPASLVIGDKAVPLSVVVEMLRDLINDNETFIGRQGDVNATRIESIKAIAKRFGITL